MSDYQTNLQIIQSCITKNHRNIVTIQAENFWINDVNQKIEVQQTASENWLQVNNPSLKEVRIYPVDGNSRVFPNTLSVSDEARFKYYRTRFSTTKNQQVTEIKPVGLCDCLLVDERLRFLEFKNGPDAGPNELSAINNRERGEKQLARTLTYFREKKSEELKYTIFEAVLVTKPDFHRPKNPSALFERGVQFFLDFQARLIELTTDEVYTI
jgi:hypothetical protein